MPNKCKGNDPSSRRWYGYPHKVQWMEYTTMCFKIKIMFIMGGGPRTRMSSGRMHVQVRRHLHHDVVAHKLMLTSRKWSWKLLIKHETMASLGYLSPEV